MINTYNSSSPTVLERARGWRFRSLKSGLAATAIVTVIGSSLAAAAVQSQTNGPAPGGNLTPEAAQSAPALPSFVSLVNTVKPAVVSVRVRSDVSPQVLADDGSFFPFEGTPFGRFFEDRSEQQRPSQRIPRQFRKAQGSGFFISADGYIVTNKHVVDNASEVEVMMEDGATLEAKVVGSDQKTDLALLKVEGRTDFPFVKFGGVKPNTGEWVVAMGNPFGLGGTVTAGIVSAQGRNIGSGPYDDYLQIDAAVNRGNSGGPTFNMKGRVIGVNTAIYSPTGGSVGIAFSIPASTAKWVIDQLKEHGSVERAWLGVKVQAVNKSIADGLGLDKAKGVLVAQTENGSPATKAGLKAGDVIVSINGAEVKNPSDLARKIGATTPNTAIKLEIMRGGSPETVEATVGKMKSTSRPRLAFDEGEGDETGKLGMTLAPAAEIDGAGDRGLAILQVDPQGKASEVGLSAGDVMLKAGEQQLASVGDLKEAMETAAAKGKSNVLVLVRRGDTQRYRAVPIA
jgi:serine protease Do